MANPEHLEILWQGVEAWNSWREREGIYLTPDLKDADLIGINLVSYYFVLTQFNGADLFYANLNGANARGADFTGANLQNAHCNGTDLHGATLKDANLRGVDFGGANISEVHIDGANLYQARLYETIIGNTDLSGAKNLDRCNHVGPCILDHRTLIKSGNLPLTFLRGCGLPDTFIEYIPSLINDPLQFYSCFISYSSKDQDFAERLYADLQNKGVRCWFAPEDLKIGDNIRDSIDESIRLRDKLLLILTESSIASDWVEHEVESALDEERQRGRTILFPIRLDDSVLESNKAWAALIRRARHVGDFTRWKEHDSYQKAFERLLRDLRAEERRSE
jgi:hypothetical protein